MLAYFLGGLAFFLYGQFLLEWSIQKASRVYLRAFVKLLAKHKFTAVFLGAILTIGMQSSTVSVLTLIDLINFGILQLGTAIGIVLGSSIGTTIIVQAISLNLSGYALWFIILGFLISRLIRYPRGELLIGLGFMLYGIYLMGHGEVLFKDINPIVNMIGAFILTVISQSTLAPLAVGITLIRDSGMSLGNAIPLILGAHIGAGVLPLIYSWKISGTTIGRQLSIANLVYRIVGVLIFLPLIGVCVTAVQWMSTNPARQLANAHTLFTLAIVCLFIPFTGLYTRFIKKILPKEEFLKKGLRLDLEGEKKKVYKLLNDSIKLWEEDRLGRIDKIEKQVLSKHLLKEGPDIKLLETIANLERISNIIGIGLVDLSRKRILQGLDFSIEGLNEVLDIHKRIIEEFRTNTFDPQIDSLISASFAAHINRMRKGFRETKETSSLHADALALLEHIHWCIKKLMAR